MDDKTRDIHAQGSSARFWGRRRTRMASATGALLLAVAATVFTIGGGASSGVTWLNGSHPSWLTFGGSVSWLPFRHVAAAVPAAHASPTPSLTPIPAAIAHTPAPTPVVHAPVAVHPPVPTAKPTVAAVEPTARPTAIPTAKPTPAPTAAPTPAPTPAGPPPGTVLFTDNFENDPIGPAVANWSLTPAADWSVASDGSHVLSVLGSGFPTATTGSQGWTNYRVSADVRTNPTDGHARLIARHYGDGYFYACGIDHPGTLFLGKEYGGSWYTFKTAPYTYVSTAWYHIDFQVSGTSLTCVVTDPVGHTTTTLTDTESYFPSGGAGVTGDTQAEFDNFVVTAI